VKEAGASPKDRDLTPLKEKAEMILEKKSKNCEWWERPGAIKRKGYTPEFCQVALEAFSQGADRKELCLILMCSRRKLKKWEEEYPEFKEALDIGEELAEAWWLKVGRMNLELAGFNTTLWKANMENRFGWSKKVENRGQLDVNVNETRRIEIDTSISARAKVLTILKKVGALESGPDPIIDAEVVAVHPALPDAEAGSVSAAG